MNYNNLQPLAVAPIYFFLGREALNEYLKTKVVTVEY